MGTDNGKFLSSAFAGRKCFSYDITKYLLCFKAQEENFCCLLSENNKHFSFENKS